jgi:DHA1 family bicyclomycin/chloramphenicol resistance-like MFS transporter
VIALSSWRGVFWAVTIAAVAGMLMMGTVLQETRPAEDRVESSLGGALRGYAFLLRDRHFMGLVLIGSFAISGFFIYLANSPFVMIDHYGLTPTQYSLAFALNAASFIGSSQFSGHLGERFGMARVVKVAAGASAAVLALLLGYYLAGGDQLAVLIGLYFVASAFMGLVIPTTSVLALEEHGAIAGTASALLGTLQMLLGAVMMGLAGLFNDGRPLSMVIGMTAGPLIALALTWGTLGGRRAQPCPAT